jgi:hypothetical protein
MELHIDALLHAFDDAGMEIAEELAAQGGRAAALSGDFDVSAITDVGMWGQRFGHGLLLKKNREFA